MYKKIFISIFLLSSLSLLAQPQAGEIDFDRLSRTLGHMIVRQIKQTGFDFNFDLVMEGMRDEREGKPSPMSDEECDQTMCALQEKQFLESVEKNLAAANAFLQQNLAQQGIHEIEPKLQYQIIQEGAGNAIDEDSVPLIHYKGKLLDGTIFAQSETTQQPVALPIKQTIPGFAKGLIGMKEGEKRILYIHPELAYGLSGHLPPNSLLIFEVEVVKANSPALSNMAQLCDELQ